jgi:hypothetical protein
MIGRIKLYLAGLGALMVALTMAYFNGRANGAIKAKNQRLKAEIDAHERINDADTGGGATDIERIKRLQHMADKLGD